MKSEEYTSFVTSARRIARIGGKIAHQVPKHFVSVRIAARACPAFAENVVRVRVYVRLGALHVPVVGHGGEIVAVRRVARDDRHGNGRRREVLLRHIGAKSRATSRRNDQYHRELYFHLVVRLWR